MRCAYVRHLWDCGESLEIEEKHTGRYGARGQKREKRKKASPEDIKRQNKWKRERDLRRLIKWNFGKYDYWMTITYRKGDRPAWEQMKKDVTDLIKKVRKRYRKLGKELKYIYRLQIGKRGGPHVHILVNRIQTENTGTDIFRTCICGRHRSVSGASIQPWSMARGRQLRRSAVWYCQQQKFSRDRDVRPGRL